MNLTIKGLIKKTLFSLKKNVIKDNKVTDIMKKCPCNKQPLTPHFYIEKLGFTGVFFLIFAAKHRFSAEKYCCLLHGRVCVMDASRECHDEVVMNQSFVTTTPTPSE